MIKVELDIFSGLPNPTWTLSKNEESELLDQLQAAPSLAQSESSVGSTLGYRGYVIHVEDDRPLRHRRLRLPRMFRIGSTGVSATSSEEWLLGTSDKAGVTSDVVRNVAKGSIAEGQAAASAPSTPAILTEPPPAPTVNLKQIGRGRKRRRKFSSPGGFTTQAAGQYWLCDDTLLFVDSPGYYDWWNRDSVRPYNNCYNFAANRITNTFAQPGRLGGQAVGFPPTCGSVHDAMRRDGYWIDSGCFVPIDISQWATAIVALVIWPLDANGNADYHFYRLIAAWDGGGRLWAHKPGKGRATNKDLWPIPITDPYSANRGPYTDFCGYYWGDAHWSPSSNQYENTHKVWVK